MSASSSSRWRRELLFLVAGLLLGFVVLPLIIYAFGSLLFGRYAGGAHRLGSFFGDLLEGLMGGSWPVWVLVVGPYVLLCVLRAIFHRRGEVEADDEPPPPRERPKRRDAKPERREPRLSS